MALASGLGVIPGNSEIKSRRSSFDFSTVQLSTVVDNGGLKVKDFTRLAICCSFIFTVTRLNSKFFRLGRKLRIMLGILSDFVYNCKGDQFYSFANFFDVHSHRLIEVIIHISAVENSFLTPEFPEKLYF
jgi:hypothetical protein